MGNADLPYEARYPILLSKDYPLTSTIIQHAHAHVLHNGVKETLIEVRSKILDTTRKKRCEADLEQLCDMSQI